DSKKITPQKLPLALDEDDGVGIAVPIRHPDRRLTDSARPEIRQVGPERHIERRGPEEGAIFLVDLVAPLPAIAQCAGQSRKVGRGGRQAARQVDVESRVRRVHSSFVGKVTLSRLRKTRLYFAGVPRLSIS